MTNMTVSVSRVMHLAICRKADIQGQTLSGLIRSVLADHLKIEMQQIVDEGKKSTSKST